MVPLLERLIADFLDDYTDRLGNDGCNDWRWPEWLPLSLRRLLSEDCGDFDFANRKVVPNWLVVKRLAKLLRERHAWSERPQLADDYCTWCHGTGRNDPNV